MSNYDKNKNDDFFEERFKDKRKKNGKKRKNKKYDKGKKQSEYRKRKRR